MRLRSLLLRWLLVPTLALWGLGFAVGYARSLQQANEAYDRTLLGSALVIGEAIGYVDGEVVVELPHAALDMLRTDAQDRIFYRVADGQNGATVTGYEDLPPPAAPPQGNEPVFYDAGFVNKNAYDFNPSGYNDNFGFGLRLFVAGAPLSLDFGIPLTKAKDGVNDKGSQFNFSFGTRF